MLDATCVLAHTECVRISAGYQRAQRVAGLVLVLAAFVLALLASRLAAAEGRVVLHAHLVGGINPVKARYITQSLERARALGAELVLLSIDTPGGLVSSMESITSAITNQPIPVVGFVEPPTAEATSAGAFVLLATDVAAMAPGTRMGAAHPVGNGKALEGPIDAKATNSLVALARSLAARHNRSESVAESIVRESTSFTASDAQKAGAVDLVCADVPELMRALDGFHVKAPNKDVTLDTKAVSIVEFPQSATSQVIERLSDPTLASIFLILGVLGILFELKSPGIGVAGIVGGICLVLALVAGSAIPLNWGGFVLVVLGLAAIALEVKANTYGALALGGLVSMILGVLVLVDETAYFGGAPRASVRVFVPVALVVTGTFLLFAAAAARAQRAPPLSGLETMAGRPGQARSDFALEEGEYRGMVFVDGARWQAIASERVVAGDSVVVEQVMTKPTRLRVRRVEKGLT